MTTPVLYRFRHYQADHSAFVADVMLTRDRRKAALEKIERSTNRDKKRFLIRQFLNDPALKLLYFFESVQAKRLLEQFPPVRMQQVAAQLSSSHHFYEVVHPVNLSTGSSGRRRTTYNFGPGKHALQRMVSDLLRAMFPLPSDRHFTIQGGVQAALRAVEGHVRNGFIYGIERDIAQFYPSVNLVELATLLRPLPFTVVMNVIAYQPGFVWSRSQSLPDAIHDVPLPLGGLLAQGSAASPIAAEVLMVDLLGGLPDNVRVISYADNVLILGETLDSVEAANAVLEAHVNEHPCGPLRLKPSDNFRNIEAHGISFLGNDGEWNGDGIDWEPKFTVIENVQKKIESRQSEAEIYDAIEWLRGWRRGYPLWKHGDEEVARYIMELGGRLAFLSRNTLSPTYTTGLRIVENYCRRVRARTGAFPNLWEALPDHQDGELIEGVRPQFIRHVERRLGISTERDRALE